MPLLLAALGLLLAAGAWHWASRPAAPGAATSTAAVAQAQDRPTPKGVADVPVAAPITLPIYVPDSRGLPPSSAPLRESHQALTAAAAAGNATAACRLAFAAMHCWSALDASGAAAVAAQSESNYAEDRTISALSARRIAQAPPALRDYVRERIEAIELARAMEGDTLREQVRRCAGAPSVRSNDVAALLRQAALAGQPDAVAAYARGDWLMTIVGWNAARTPDRPPPPLEIFRDPTFREWRREAAAIETAGLEAGLLTVIESAAMPNRVGWLDQLVAYDPVRQAAALRTLAARVGSSAPPSTRTLGLDIEQARDADQLSERWIAAAAERDAVVDSQRLPANTMMMLGRLPTCE
jgi:hypothetical protein